MPTKGGAGTQNPVTVPSLELYTLYSETGSEPAGAVFWDSTNGTLAVKLTSGEVYRLGMSASGNFFETVEFDTTYTETGTEPTGSLFWDDTNKTLSLALEEGVIYQLGKETYFNVINQTGATIQDGQVIAYAGAVGASGKIQGQLGIADGSIEYYKHLGLATREILNGESGEVTILGAVRGIDTTGTPVGEVWSEGDILFVSPTTAGALTNVEPVAPYPIIGIAVVVNVHAVNGTVGVRTTFITRLNITDQIGDGTSGSILFVDGDSELCQDNDSLYFDHIAKRLLVGTRSTGDYSEFEADGTLVMNGEATVWNDANVGGLTLSGPPPTQPDIEEVLDLNGDPTNFFTRAFAVGEKAGGAIEVPHGYENGSDIQFHVHWTGNTAPTGTDYVRWAVDYFLSRDGVPTAPSTSVEFETEYSVQYVRVTSGILLDGTDIKKGDQFCFTLSRIASTGAAYAGTALIQTVGLHVLEDGIGSRVMIPT